MSRSERVAWALLGVVTCVVGGLAGGWWLVAGVGAGGWCFVHAMEGDS